MVHAGIDWADEHHNVFIVDDGGQKLTSFRIPHSADGFDTLLNKVSPLITRREEVLFAIETDKGLLVSFLLDQGFTVYAINPKAVNRFRDRYKLSGAKSDEIDAMTLANILRTDRDRFRPLLPNSEEARELKILCRDREHLVRLRTRLTNQLTACLKSYYPLALKIFQNVESSISLAFLESYPTPEEAKRLSTEEMSQFLSKQHYPHPRRVEEICQRLKEPQIPADPLIVRTKSMYMLSLIPQLRVLNKRIKLYEERIEEILKSHPDGGIFSSLPGAGPVLASGMLGEFGDNRDLFSNFNSVQCQAGTAPVTKQSGNYRHVELRRACAKPFRNVMHQFSFCSLKECTWAREYYRGQRAKGKTHSKALRALGNKWMKIIHAMWRDRKPYDESHYLAMKARYGLRTAA